MFYNAFDDLLPTELKEVNKPNGGLLAPELSKQIDEVNEYVYNDINNGVYKCGFAGSQEAYDTNVVTVFNALDRMEKHLESVKDQGPYIFGAHLTDSDLRLYTTIIRFDVGYFQQFKVNLRMIRYEYPNLHRWLRHLYWDAGEETRGAFKGTTDFDQVSVVSEMKCGVWWKLIEDCADQVWICCIRQVYFDGTSAIYHAVIDMVYRCSGIDSSPEGECYYSKRTVKCVGS